MNRLIACTLALLVVLLTPASANSAPTRLGGTGGLPCHCHRRAAHL